MRIVAVADTHLANVTTWECERAPTVIEIDANTIVPIEVAHRRRPELA